MERQIGQKMPRGGGALKSRMRKVWTTSVPSPQKGPAKREGPGQETGLGPERSLPQKRLAVVTNPA